MKSPTLAALAAAFAITCGGNQGCAQSEPVPSLPPSSRKPLNEPLHEKFTADAWTAFQTGKYEAAITNADLCISRFAEAANKIQAVLDSEKASLPTGAVSDDDKKRLAQYQILHDVATCFLIKGWAEEKLGHKEAARKAYTEATKYTLARSSKPTGQTFWSPAQKASEHLPK
jgi:tetratricopeptide (TPR) repeat protein